jgi:hypothetical protein
MRMRVHEYAAAVRTKMLAPTSRKAEALPTQVFHIGDPPINMNMDVPSRLNPNRSAERRDKLDAPTAPKVSGGARLAAQWIDHIASFSNPSENCRPTD